MRRETRVLLQKGRKIKSCSVDVIEPLGNSLKSFGYEARRLGSCEPGGALCKANTHFLLHFLSVSVVPQYSQRPLLTFSPLYITNVFPFFHFSRKRSQGNKVLSLFSADSHLVPKLFCEILNSWSSLVVVVVAEVRRRVMVMSSSISLLLRSTAP